MSMIRLVTCANNEKLHCEGVDKAIVMLHDKPGERAINNVAYVPNLAANLLSINILAKRGLTTIFSKKGCHMYKNKDVKIDGVVFASASEECGTYHLNCNLKATVETTMTANVERNQVLWHRRLAHPSHQNMLILRDMSYGMKFSNEKLEKCKTCIKGKQTSKAFSKVKGTRARDILGIVRTDICGPMSVPSWSGSRYFMTLIDDKTRKTFVYFLKHKSEVGNILKEFKAVTEKQSDKRIKIIRSDNAKEYVNNHVNNFLKRNGIRHQLSVEYTPQQNGVAEKANRTIVEKTKSMLIESGLNTKYWAEAVNTAVYLKNRSPTKALSETTPEQAWSGDVIYLVNKTLITTKWKIFLYMYGAVNLCSTLYLVAKAHDELQQSFIIKF
jgi:transposase InsO family protein